VLFWRRLPSPSTEMLMPPDAGGVAASEATSPARPAADENGCCRRQAAKIDVRARIIADGARTGNLAGDSGEGNIGDRPELPSSAGSRVTDIDTASALRFAAVIDKAFNFRDVVEHTFSIGGDDLFAGYPDSSAVRHFDASFVDYDLGDLGAQADAVDSYDDFEAFLVNLLRSSQVNRSRYRDAPIWPFLDAILWCLEDFDHYFYWREPKIPRRPSWRLLGQLLFIALFRDTPEANRWVEECTSITSVDLKM
jgi:hypothetical protein